MDQLAIHLRDPLYTWFQKPTNIQKNEINIKNEVDFTIGI